MRRHRALAQALGQFVGQALGHAPGVDEDQGGPVGLDVTGNLVQDVAHLLRRGHRLEILGGQFDGQVEIAPMPDIHHLAKRASFLVAAALPGTHQEPRQGFNRALGRRKPNSSGALRAEGVQAFETEGQMRAPLVPGHGMNLVDDHAADAPQQGAAALGGEQQKERFRRGDQDLRRMLEHGGPGRSRGIAAAQGHAQLGHRISPAAGRVGDLLEGIAQVVLDIRRERLEGRHVDDFDARRRARRGDRGTGLRLTPEEGKPRLPLTRPLGRRRLVETIDADQESREGLARARGRGDQRVMPSRNGGPTVLLGERRALGKTPLEPLPHRGMETLELPARAGHRACRRFMERTLAASCRSAQ